MRSKKKYFIQIKHWTNTYGHLIILGEPCSPWKILYYAMYILNERGVIRPEWRNRPEGMPSGLEIYMGGRKEKIHTSICSSPVLNIYKKYKNKMATRMPWLTCEPMIKNYFSQISRLRPERIVCFFLSSLPLS
jgi:hypothetical protein